MNRSGPRGPYSSGLATREAILAAATEVFARAGDTGFGMRDVAKAANVSHPTVCCHFESRVDLMRAVYVRYEQAQGVYDVSLDDHGMLTQPRLRWSTLPEIVFAYVRGMSRPDGAVLALYDCRMTLYASDPATEFHRIVRVRGMELNEVLMGDIARMQREGHCSTRLKAESLAMLIMNCWAGIRLSAGFPATADAMPGPVRFVTSVVEMLDLTAEGFDDWMRYASEDIMPILQQVRMAYGTPRVGHVVMGG